MTLSSLTSYNSNYTKIYLKFYNNTEIKTPFHDHDVKLHPLLPTNHHLFH